MTVMLSSLRITADMEASGYVRGAAQIKAGSDQAVAAAKAMGQAFAQQDAALANSVPGMARLSRELITGYGEGAKFYSVLQRIEGALNRGMSADRAALMVQSLYEKTGMVANATDLWNQKLQMTSQVVDQVNRKITAQGYQSALNQRLGVRDDFGTAKRGEDVAAYGQELDRLRGRFDPLFAAERRHQAELDEINKAYRVGAFGAVGTAEAQAVLNKALADSNQRLELTKLSLGATNQAARLTAGAYNNLAFQVNDVITGLALGQPLWQVAAQQGGQIYQIFSMSATSVGGFGNAVKAAIGGLKDTAIWLARNFGGYIALASGIGLATSALSAFNDGQREIMRQMIGAGTASGLSLTGINRIAESQSSIYGLSIKEAREFATTLAATGRIGKDSIEQLVGLGKDVARVFGIDATEAADMLAKALVDPAKGAEQLNQRLLAFDAATMRNIQNLVAQNRIMEAQKVISDGIAASVKDINIAISSSTNFWTAVGNIASNVWGKIGEGLSRATGIGLVEGLDEQIKTAEQRLASWQAKFDNMSPMQQAGEKGRQLQVILEQERTNVERLKTAWGEYERSVDAAQKRRDSLANSASIGKMLPEREQLQALKNDLAALVRISDDYSSGDDLKAMGRDWEDVAKAIDRAKGLVLGFKNATDQTLAGLDIQLRAISATSPGQKGQIAYEQSLLNQRSRSAEAIRIAEAERRNATAQVQRQLFEAERDRTLQAQQRVETAQMELSILGRSVGEQERARAVLQAKQQLEQEALRIYGDRNAYDKRHLEALTAQIDKETQLKQLLAEQNAMRDARFERQQIGMTDTDAGIASKLRNIYGDNWASQMDGAIAQQLRFNEALRQAKDYSVEFAQGFARDIRAGIPPLQALTNAVNRLFDRMLDAAVNQLVTRAFGGLLGSLGGGMPGMPIPLSASMGAPGGGMGLMPGGLYHTGGIVGSGANKRYIHPAYYENAPRFHGGGVAGDEVPIIARRGEGVFTREQMAAMGGSRVQVNVINNAEGTKVEEKRRSEGGVDIVEVIVSTVNDAMANGKFDGVMRARHGLSLKATPR